MKKEFLAALKPGDIFKLDNSIYDIHRIVTGVTIEQVNHSKHTLVKVYYAFADEDYNDIFQTSNTWPTTKKVYKVSI